MKTCCRCHVPLSLDQFNRDRGSQDGRDPMCRLCRKAQKADYYARNRERVLAKVLDHQRQHPDQINARNQRYRERHPDRVSQQNARYQNENRAAINTRSAVSKAKRSDYYRQKTAEWFRSHPGKAAEYQATRRARQLASPAIEKIDRAAIVERDRAICHLCHTLVDLTLPHRHPMSLTLDHVVPLARGGGHTAANLKVAHWRCNSRKNATLLPH